eukprot:CAMPEP_0205941030 /NCGR_PEP_ID=MMETSP1325-20131115/53849_1 /ASSEMBLY_ACC=CAM_ASM_000708 /TAXON_ID=236786 /ORGANISM="Florenciella sp., Strain RCC1007" /LENGTH=59 /DNA_ID=CAMNT_0053311639 /DNA_START=133 /DNA_END=309 /DNA_ORIENTATION=+
MKYTNDWSSSTTVPCPMNLIMLGWLNMQRIDASCCSSRVVFNTSFSVWPSRGVLITTGS